MTSWAQSSIFYHIYPLGLLDAPKRNDFSSAPVHRIDHLAEWLDHIQSLGANAIYLGPVFESTAHGYDTADYFQVDRRLGTNADLQRFSREMHRRGMRLVLDGVFNHTGRDFWAFRDVLANGESSSFRDWFHNLQFGHKSPYGDPFSYTGWDQHYDLVKLNLKNREVKEHLFSAIDLWVDEYEIDGIRLDAADVLDLDFLHEFRIHCDKKMPDLWLMGEVVQGDYRKWMNPAHLHSVTNYECYKGSYSSLVDRNYFEIAYSLNRLFGTQGLYRGENLYNFVDNHDVNRVASLLPDPRLLFPLYLLLFCMPGIPSIYYGSEWGLGGNKTGGSDDALRPALDIRTVAQNAPQPHLADTIRSLAQSRKRHVSLQAGDYRQVMVAHQQFVFCRTYAEDTTIVCLNADQNSAHITIQIPHEQNGLWQDELDPAYKVELHGQKDQLDLPACWGRILKKVG